MPARIFRYQLTNSVQGHTLNLVTEHLCGGEYTPGGWRPVGVIASGATAGIQAESAGFLTGTQGWVKYRIVRDSDQAQRGLVYLYWTNPYFGVTYGKHALVGQDIVADCDEDEPGGGSSFAEATQENAAPSGLHLKVTGIRKNGSPTNVDAVGDAYRIPLAPIWVIGAGQIWERMELNIELTSSETPTLFPGPGTRTRRLETKPMPAIVAGNWVGQNVSVSIARGHRLACIVDIEDDTPGHAFALTTTCYFGRDGFLRMMADAPYSLSTILANGEANESIASRGQAVTALAAVLDVVRREATPGNLRTVARAQSFRDAAVAMNVAGSPVLSAMSRAAAEALTWSDYTLQPAPGVAIQLFLELEDDQLRGYSLKYQRLNSDGSVITDQFLIPRIDIN